MIQFENLTAAEARRVMDDARVARLVVWTNGKSWIAKAEGANRSAIADASGETMLDAIARVFEQVTKRTTGETW